MSMITKNYANGATRTFEVTGVTATEDAHTIEIATAADGVVLLCQHDDAALWQQLVTLGLIPS